MSPTRPAPIRSSLSTRFTTGSPVTNRKPVSLCEKELSLPVGASSRCKKTRHGRLCNVSIMVENIK